MKILVPFMNPTNTLPGQKPLEGGIEKFIIQIQETFDDVKICQLPFVVGKIPPRQYSDIVIRNAREYNADLIISNYPKGWCVGPYIQKCGIPIMFVMHTRPEFPFMVRSCHRWFKGIKENNHSLYFVSNFQKYMWDNYRTKKYRQLFDVDGYINSSYCIGKKPNLNDINWDCGTIGRCSKTKGIFKVHSLLQDTNFKTVVLTNQPWGYDKKYYEQNKDLENTIIDLSHKKVMEELSTFATFFSTWEEETWGITSLEALSHGVPIILNSKNNIHASETIPKDERHFRKIILDDKDELIQAITDLKKVDRKEIQDMTWEKHLHEKWKTHFENCIDKTIETFKNGQNEFIYSNI